MEGFEAVSSGVLLKPERGEGEGLGLDRMFPFMAAGLCLLSLAAVLLSVSSFWSDLSSTVVSLTSDGVTSSFVSSLTGFSTLGTFGDLGCSFTFDFSSDLVSSFTLGFSSDLVSSFLGFSSDLVSSFSFGFSSDLVSSFTFGLSSDLVFSFTFGSSSDFVSSTGFSGDSLAGSLKGGGILAVGDFLPGGSKATVGFLSSLSAF